MKTLIQKNQDEISDKILKIMELEKAKILTSNKSSVANLIEQGRLNAFVYLQRSKKQHKLNILEENSLYVILHKMQEQLNLSTLPKRIECYDISHLSGKFVYGSCVVFIDGRPNKKLYRLFKTKDQNNDFENHKEVLKRRLLHSESGWELPDLIVVDGGKGQLSSDLQVLKELNLEHINMVSLAKKEEEIFTVYHLENHIEKGFKLTPDCNFMLERIRDEAHRFAITANRNKRLKTITETSLDNIEGIGSTTIENLLKTFGSMKEIQKSIIENPTLMIKLIGEKRYLSIKKHFNY
jgi:excinuclease ABC subunit C